MASVGRLAREALPHLRLLAVGTACLVAAALADLGLTQTTGRLLDLLGGPAPAEKMEAIDAAFWRLGGCFCVIAIVKHIGEYLLRLAGEQLSARVRKQLCLAIVCQPVSYFDRSATGELVSLLWMDVEGLRLAVAFHLPDLVRFALACAASGIGMALVSIRLTCYGALCAPLIGVLASYIGTHVGRLERAHQEQMGRATAIATEGFASARVLKAFGQEEWMAHRFGVEVDACASYALRAMRVHKLWNANNWLLASGATLLILRTAALALTRGEMSAGDIAQLGLLGLATGNAASDAANAWTRTAAQAAKGARALALLDAMGSAATTPAAEAATAEADAPCDADGVEALTAAGNKACFGVSLVDVSFAYPAGSASTSASSATSASPASLPGVLDGLRLEAAAGETSALVGPSGCGKSTVLHLLLRFYDADGGTVRFGGVDVRALPVAWLRDHVAVVPQEPTLFCASFRENIGLGQPSDACTGGWSDERLSREVRGAAKAAAADEFILHAGGYDATVGERGASLSGGQRQRIAIARALLRAPRLLLLDEATAALDNESERAVQAALAGLRRTTTIVVAHRLSTIREAARIHVLQAGRVVECGRHEELMVKAGGLYARLARVGEVG